MSLRKKQKVDQKHESENPPTSPARRVRVLLRFSYAHISYALMPICSYAHMAICSYAHMAIFTYEIGGGGGGRVGGMVCRQPNRSKVTFKAFMHTYHTILTIPYLLTILTIWDMLPTSRKPQATGHSHSHRHSHKPQPQPQP